MNASQVVAAFWARRGLAGLCLTALTGCGAGSPERDAPASFVHSWLTTPDRSQLLTPGPDVAFAADTGTVDRQAPEVVSITVDTTEVFQEVAGFGAALTDAAAWLIQHRLSPSGRDSLLRELFSPEHGIGLSLARVTIGASDFSLTPYTFDDVAPGARDEALEHFSLAAHQADVIPTLKAARAYNPTLQLMATPWSAPAWMKTSASLVKGTLRRDAYPAFAEYLTRVVESYAEAGIPIALLSVQNEPYFEPDDYPGMRFDAPARAEFVGRFLGPRLAQRAPKVQVLDWDHNWDAPEAPLRVLKDSVARQFIQGVAWHCYAGDVSAQSRVHDAYPDKDTWFTECSGGAWAPNFGDNLRWTVRTLMIGATRHWARGVMLWNLALDEHHGPHLGGCNDCRGVVTIDSATGAVTRNEEYFALAHASRWVRQGARRIGSSAGEHDVDNVAFRNRDGTVVVLAVNSSGDARTLALRSGARRALVTLPAGAVATYTWR